MELTMELNNQNLELQFNSYEEIKNFVQEHTACSSFISYFEPNTGWILKREDRQYSENP